MSFADPLRQTSANASYPSTTPRNAQDGRLSLVIVLVSVTIALLVQGCSTPERLAAVPKDQQAAAVVGEMGGIRYWQIVLKKGDCAVA